MIHSPFGNGVARRTSAVNGGVKSRESVPRLIVTMVAMLTWCCVRQSGLPLSKCRKRLPGKWPHPLQSPIRLRKPPGARHRSPFCRYG